MSVLFYCCQTLLYAFKITEMINEQTRLAAACRRFKFECIKALGVFWLIDKIHWLNIKEPWNKLYKRANK